MIQGRAFFCPGPKHFGGLASAFRGVYSSNMPSLKHLLWCGLVAVFVASAVGARPAATAESWYRVRLAPGPAAARTNQPERAEELVARMQALSRDLGITMEPAVPAAAIGSLRARLAAQPQTARRSPSGAQQSTLDELLRWGRIAVPEQGRAEFLARLDAEPGIDLIEPVAIADLAALIPDDEYLLNQRSWIDLVGLPQAWAQAAVPVERRARVAIVDGGTDWMHPDLLANVAINLAEIPGDGIDQDGNGFIDDVQGWTFATGTGDPSPLPEVPYSGRHGTHVAGLVGAVLGNGVGIAGAGGNPELILVNAAHPTQDGGIAFGYEGILYALTRGADIINCSWRTARFVGPRASDAGWSEYEALVLRLAREAGALVIAATGNDADPDLWSTPAAYEDCMAVSATSYNEAAPWSLSNLGDWVDIMAPGQFMISTVPRGSTGHLGPYDLLSGTSMAAALTSGVAALLKGQHPEWTAEQLRSRLRWTGAYHDALGNIPLLRADLGLANTERPDIVLAVDGISDADGDGFAEGGEVVDLRFSARALFERQVAVQVRFESDDPWLIPLVDRLPMASIGTEAPLEFTRGLKFWVNPATPPGHVASVRLRAVVGGVEGPVENGFVQLRPLAAVVTAPSLTVQASANGVLGPPTQVVSRVPYVPALSRSGASLGYLQRAALLLATGADRVSDAVLPRAPISSFKDFSASQNGLERTVRPDGSTDLVLRYGDFGAAATLGVTVEQRVQVPGVAGRDYLIVEYRITAVAGPLADLRWGLAMDWSAPAADAVSGYLAEQLEVLESGLGMRVRAADPGQGAGIAGALLLGEVHEVGVRSMREWADETEPGWNIPGAFSATATDSVLWDRMQPGQGEDLARTGARVGVLSAALGPLERGESRTIALALALGADETELSRQLSMARVTWEAQQAGLDPERLQDSVVRFSHNPFRSGTELSFALAQAGPVHVAIYDLRGRLVRELLDAPRPAGVHRLPWDGTDDRGAGVASGVYLLQLSTDAATQTVRITRVR